jgi:hypothetical protein
MYSQGTLYENNINVIFSGKSPEFAKDKYKKCYSGGETGFFNGRGD